MNEQNSILKFMIILRCLLYGMASRNQDVLIDNIEVVVNETAFINCIANASVDIQWHFNSIFNYVYAGGGIKVPYLGRLRMEKDGAKMNTLIIPMVTPEDVGWYYCSEEETGRRFTATYLTVLYSIPVCYSNMKPEGFIGSQTCCNFDQNYMIFNCDVSFKGEPPRLTWSLLNDSKTFNSSTVCKDQPNRRNCSITLKPDHSYDGSIFICQIESTNGIGYRCSTEVIKVLYFFVHHDFIERKVNDNVSCPIRSNLNVRYKWTFKQDNKDTLLSSNQILSIHNPGIYQCEVEYNIRNASCFLVASVVKVESGNVTTIPVTANSGSTTLAIILSIVLMFAVLSTGMFILMWKRRKRKRENKRKENTRREYERRKNERRENERIRKKIQDMQKYFVSNVDPQDVLESLIHDHVINKEDSDIVLNKETTQDNCQALLNHLSSSSSHTKSFIVLKNALDIYYPWVAERIDANYCKPATIPENERIKDKVVSIYKDFTSEVDPKNIVGLIDLLIQSRIVSIEEKQRIMNKDTEKERCRSLVDHLFFCSEENAFIILREALKECYPKIVERIDASDQDNETKDMTLTDENKQENERIRNRVVAIYEDFVPEVDPEKVLDYLIQTKIVNLKQRRYLTNQATTEDQCKALLDLLFSCSKDNEFISLKEALKQHYPGIIERIDSSTTDDEVLNNPNRRSTMHLESSIIVFGDVYVFRINLNSPDDVSVLQELPMEVSLYMTAAVYCDSVFVTGIGDDIDEIWRFDARCSKWNKCASLIKGRSDHSLAFVDHILYVCGGWGFRYGVFGDVLDDVEAYDAIDDKCSVVGKLTYAVYDAGNCVAYKVSLYIFGGRNAKNEYVNSVQVYNTRLNSCTILTKSMPRKEAHLRAGLFKNYVLLIRKKSCFLYNFDADTWEVRDQFKTGVVRFGMTVHKENLFVIGGRDSKGILRDDVRYVPILNILNDEPIDWKLYAKSPKPFEVYAFAKMEVLVKYI